ncbi:MAG: TetR-like C-terminal domain-containing protein [Pseudomonadota bacterium]
MARRSHDAIRTSALAVAEHYVRQDGVEGLSTRRLAGAIGVSVGTLYNIFGHADGIVRGVNRRTMSRLHTTLSEALEAAPPGRETRLIALARAYLDFALENPTLWDALFRHRLDTPPEAPVEAEAEALMTLLRTAAGEGVPDDALLALWAAVHGVVELAAGRRLLTPAPAAPRQYLEIIVRAGIRGITAGNGNPGH